MLNLLNSSLIESYIPFIFFDILSNVFSINDFLKEGYPEFLHLSKLNLISFFIFLLGIIFISPSNLNLYILLLKQLQYI